MSELAAIALLLDESAGLVAPSGLMYDRRRRRLAIVDGNRRRLLSLDMPSKELAEIPLGPCVKHPLAIAGLGEQLVVTDVEENQIWLQSGADWAPLIPPDALSPPLNFPGSVAGDRRGALYFTDFFHNRIGRIDRRGKVSVLHELHCEKPYGLCVWGDWAYVTDTAGGRILSVLTPEGRVAVVTDGDSSGFSPIAVAADEEGDLYIATARRLFVYHQRYQRLERILDTRIWRRWRTEPLSHIGALAPLPDGRLVISDTIQNRLYCLEIDKACRGGD